MRASTHRAIDDEGGEDDDAADDGGCDAGDVWAIVMLMMVMLTM